MFTAELKQRLSTKNYWPKDKVLHHINMFESELQKKLEGENKIVIVKNQRYAKPASIMPGDVVSVPLIGMPHPGIVWKVRNGICYCIVLSTTQAQHNIYKLEHSRIFTSFVTKTIVELPLEDALVNFVTVFDSKKELKIVFSLLKEYYTVLSK